MTHPNAVVTTTSFLHYPETGISVEVEHVALMHEADRVADRLFERCGKEVKVYLNDGSSDEVVPGTFHPSVRPAFTESHLDDIMVILLAGNPPLAKVPRPAPETGIPDTDTWVCQVNVRIPKPVERSVLVEHLQRLYDEADIDGTFHVGPVLPLKGSPTMYTAQVVFYRSLTADSDVIHPLNEVAGKDVMQASMEELLTQLHDEFENGVDCYLHSRFLVDVLGALGREKDFVYYS